MSDYEDMSFEEMRETAVSPLDFLEKPDINDYLYDYEPEWLEVWELSPVEDMTVGQIEAMIDIVMDWEGDWDELYAEMMEDFWEWFNENYGGDGG